MRYPHGRCVHFGYGDGVVAPRERLKSISVDVYSGSAWTSPTVLSGALYEPYGAIRAYQINPPGASPARSALAVEYLTGSNSRPTPSTCSSVTRSDYDTDFSGRLRELFVSSGALGPAWTGDVFKRRYTWKADQLLQQETCLLSAAAPRTEVFESSGHADGYDGIQRLVHTSRPAGEFRATGGALGRRDYTYDVRGNRLTENHECWSFQETYADSVHPDRLSARASVAATSCGGAVCPQGPPPGSAFVRADFTLSGGYDADGRVMHKLGADARDGGVASNGLATVQLDFDASIDGHAAVGSVYRAVSVNGSQFDYWYDADGRRRLKVYPHGQTDEAFYEGRVLVEDRGAFSDPGASPGANDTLPLDEYVYAGSTPVVLLRSSFTSTWARQPDIRAGGCQRNGDVQDCGVYFPVNDYLPKPLLLIDSYGRVAGSADYEPFGHVNRVTYVSDTPRTAGSYQATSPARVLAYLNQLPGNGAAVRARVRYANFDTASTASVSVTQSNGTTAVTQYGLGTPLPALSVNQGRALIGKWFVVPADGRFHVRFSASQSPATVKPGVTLEGYEYQRYEIGATPAWIPLRFPGQYHDAETDLFQNFNRFYDPQTGRYLEPEQLWMESLELLKIVLDGRSVPLYAYSGNNPLLMTDPTGLIFDTTKSKTAEKALEELCLQDSTAGAQCRELRDNAEFLLIFQEKTVEQDSDLREAGGALTEVTKTKKVVNPKTGETKLVPIEATVTIDFARATSEATKRAAGVTSMMPDMVVGHEGGHGYADSRGFWNPGKKLTPANEKIQKQLSLQWENAFRPPDSPRTKH
jgi:RHS repeat-associated protein